MNLNNQNKIPCNCEGNNRPDHFSANCQELKKELMCVCFALDETILYLDVYPDDREALNYYHKLIQEKKRLLTEYESACGPLNAYGNSSHSSWDWIKSPWPWKYEANI